MKVEILTDHLSLGTAYLYWLHVGETCGLLM